ncbi:MAG: hypothetical protein ACOX9R_12490 [Armatimonadota bacterium]|jgi:hypothetical protein
MMTESMAATGPSPTSSAPSGGAGPPERRLRARGSSRIALAIALLILLVAGCGAKETIARGTPKATAEAFIEAMKAGQYETVAAGFDFETYARRENPDWDTFGGHQRDLIVEKLREDQARELSGLAGMFAGDTSLGDVRQQGDTASVTVTAGANALTLQMKQIDDEWWILSMVERTD